jgi:hypothetical protein
MSRTSHNIDNNFGAKSANDLLKLANGIGKADPFLSSQISSSPSSILSRSKLLKKFAIHLIRFCLKSGITTNKNITQFLKENEIVLKNRTFDRYKSLAEKELENDLDADIWLSEKVQNALVHDYKDISDRYDRQLILDDMLMQSLVKQAIDNAIKVDKDPDKYFKYFDINEMMKVQAISNYTMKNKLELLSKGFIMYKIKEHIDYLHEQQRNVNANDISQRYNTKEVMKEKIKDSTDSTIFSPIPDQNDDLRARRQEDYQYFRRIMGDEISMSMNGIPMKTYLVEYEKKLGEPLTDL